MDATASSTASRALTLSATSLGFVVVQLDVTIVNVALQRIGATMGGGVANLQWVVDAYTLAFASLILTAGAFGDRLGAKRVFIVGFVIFTLASAICGIAPGLSTLIVGRVLQGVGAAVLVPCSLALLNNTFREPKARAKAVALWAGGASVALALGPLVGGVLINAIGWRSIFFINLPLGVAGIVLTLRYASESQRSQTRSVDLPGQVSVALTLAALAAGAIESGRLGWGSAFVLGAGIVALVAGAAGVGLVVPPMTSAILGAVEPQQSGVASGALNATRQSGSVVGVALYGALIAGKDQLAHGARTALCISAAILVLALAVVAVYVRKPAVQLKDRPPANPSRRISPEDACSGTGRRALEEAYPQSNRTRS